jgi:hypothetical protein
MNAQLESAKKTLQGMQNVAPQSGASIGSFNGKPIYAGSDASVAQQMGVTPAQNSPVVMKANEVNAPVAAPVIPPADTNQGLGSSIEEIKSAYDRSVSSASTQASNQNQEYINTLKGLLTKQENKTYDLNTAMETAGVNRIAQEQRDLEGQIATKMASLNAGLTNIEGKAIPMEFITGQQAEMKRQAGAELSVLQARQAVLQGNLANAKDAAERAVNLIYGPDEQRIKNLQTFISLNKDTMDAEEKKQAVILEQSLKQQEVALQEKKTMQAYALGRSAQYPDAGISPSDTSEQVDAKILKSPSYLLEQTNKERVATAEKPATAAQETLATYASRIEQSQGTLNSMQDTIKNMNAINFEAQMNLPSYLQSSNIQQYNQAARNFINAVLRRESGAVISEQEFDSARKQYLPYPGDSDATLQNKANSRLIVQNSFIKGAGSAYQNLDSLLGNTSKSLNEPALPPTDTEKSAQANTISGVEMGPAVGAVKSFFSELQKLF